MSNFDRNYATSYGAGRAVAIDAGLRAYMLRVYNYMAAGVALTGVLSWLTYQAAVVTNAAGNVVGLMPHPEHAVDPLTGSTDGRVVFEDLERFAA